METYNVENMAVSRQKLNRLRRLDFIGKGSYGVVFKAMDKLTGDIVAVKQIKDYSSEVGAIFVMREINGMRNLRHHNIVQLKDVLYPGLNSFFMVLEYLELDLRIYLRRMTSRPHEMLVRSYTKQLMAALFYMHYKSIMHRDLKPENILIDRKGNLKVSDFGLSRSFTVPLQNYTPKVVTIWYRAPEILFGWQSYGPKVDMWSAGCMLAELIHRRILFDGYTEIDQIKRIFRVLGTPDRAMVLQQKVNIEAEQFNATDTARGLDHYIAFHSKEQQAFMESLIVYNPDVRNSAIQCLQMDYLQNVEKVHPQQMCFYEPDNVDATRQEIAS